MTYIVKGSEVVLIGDVGDFGDGQPFFTAADARAAAEAKPDRRSGVDPKAAVIGDPQPAAPSGARAKGPDGLTVGQRSMLKIIEMKHGKAERAKAEARLGIRAA